jgi:cyclohexa-1,5-dienecarbonyl-CoA hydratase
MMQITQMRRAMAPPIRVQAEAEGQIERIVLDRPPGNILDVEMFAAIRGRLAALSASPGRCKLVVFEGSGAHFSFGASVAEHLPDRVRGMLAEFRLLLRELEATSLPTAAVVRGQCLGGGLELAAWCGRVFCDPTARFAVPEIKLAVFPPIAAIVLPWRAGGTAATEMILSGSAVEGEAAVRLGIADSCSPDPEASLQQWFAEALETKSALALRIAWKAVRRPLARRLETDLPELEGLYLDELMRHRDPLEGLRAFLEKRKPVWKDR